MTSEAIKEAIGELPAIEKATLASWLYAELPEKIQQPANEKYRLFHTDPFHPSLKFQAKGNVWTVAVGRSYRSIGRRDGDDIHWV